MSPRPPRPGRTSPSHEHKSERERKVDDLKNHDPAAHVIDVAKRWRNAQYRVGNSIHGIFDENTGADNGRHLMWLAETLRAEQRPADAVKPYEEKFLDYINLDTQYNNALDRINMQVLSGGAGEDADFQRIRNVEAIRDELQEKYDDPTTTRQQKRRLERDIKALNRYIQNNGYLNPNGTDFAGYYLATSVESENNPDDPTKQTDAARAEQLFDEHIEDTQLMFEAAMVIQKYKDENGRRVYESDKAARKDVRRLAEDPALRYVEASGYKRQSVSVPKDHGESPASDEEKKAEKDKQQPRTQDQQDMAAQLEEAKKRHRRQRIERKLQEVILDLDGGTKEINGRMVQIEGVRNELARIESRIIRNSKIGRFVMKLVGVDVAQERAEARKRYVYATGLKFGLETSIEVEDKLIDAKEIELRELRSLEAESNALRQLTSEHMRNTLVARFCRALGKFEFRDRKSWLKWGGITGAALIAAPMTGGASMAAAAALMAAAKADASWRGLPSATKRMTSGRLLRRMRELQSNPEPIREEALKAGYENVDELKKYQLGMLESLKRFDADMTWERAKRVSALGVGAVAAAAGNFVGSAVDFHGDSVYGWMGDKWTEFVGTDKPTINLNEWSSLEEYLRDHYNITYNSR